MQVISLFSGIGGFELAAEWAGWTNIASCEINPFGRRVLEYYWPDAYHHDDIHTLSYETIKEKSKWDESKPTIVLGGFPCQPYSAAGKRLGKNDDRHLWPEMLRIIREVKPAWVVGENVFGLVNWSGGLVFEEVQADLEAEGYEVQPFVLPAAGVGAPHRRDRVWFVAYANDKRRTAGFGQIQSADGEISERHDNAELGNAGDRATADTESARTGQDIGWLWSMSNGLGKWEKRPAADTEHHGHLASKGRGGNGENSKRRKEGQKHTEQFKGVCQSEELGCLSTADTENTRQQTRFKGSEEKQSWRGSEPMGSRQWDGFPTQSPVRSRNDGLSSGLVGITVSKHRNESIKAYGNAIVPQVVYQIFKAINQFTQNL